jgi:hypothetical protein
VFAAVESVVATSSFLASFLQDAKNNVRAQRLNNAMFDFFMWVIINLMFDYANIQTPF